MRFNLSSYIKSPIFIICTLIYIVFFISYKVYFLKIISDIEIVFEQYLFLEGLALILRVIDPKFIIINIVFLTLPPFLYTLIIGFTYYHHTFEIDSTYVYLRISRKQKLIRYYLEIIIIYLLVFIITIFYQLLVAFIFFDISINWIVLLRNLLITLTFNMLMIFIMIIFQLISTDWISSGITLLLFIVFSYGNYLFFVIFKYDDIELNLFNKYIPTLMNALKHNNLLYALIYILLGLGAISFSVVINNQIDINKEVIK